MDNSEDRSTDKRVQRTRAAIHATFRDMICEMDAPQITVKELAARAGINRKTFYLHYPSIEALFESMLQQIAEGYFDEMAELAPDHGMDETNRVFFEYFARQGEYVERLFCAPSYRDFCNRLLTTTLIHNRTRYNPYAFLPQAKQNIVNEFLATGSLDMYRRWVTDGKVVPLDEVIELTTLLLCNGVDALLAQARADA